MGGRINTSFLALIDKEVSPSSSRFTPISLCDMSYKTISKVIAFRIRSLLLGIISKNQVGFVGNKKIVDNVILVQEAIHSSNTKGDKVMAIKLDMANSFERIWRFLLLVILGKMGFCSKLFAWVVTCIKNPRISIVIIGNPLGFFKALRGLWQGCPPSPIIYMIMDEVMSRKLAF